MIKCVFSMSLKSLQELINSVFKFIQLQLLCHHDSCISKRAKTVSFMFKTKNKGKYSTRSH
ncbi:Mobile element protein [Candidatus Enterovibrio altilux]|uniref:Mobile element protein n=1 Tax=Candidatus Enterovibrio altilux TaxID=1927128 RepID=A0A291B8E5_9GAMM|nr:Mobile element protein [Candidatus Enterovibrio luxaltus]